MARKGIFKRSGVWYIRYAGPDGKIIRKSTGTDKYKEAELMLHTEKKAVQEGKHPEAKILKNYTFSELGEKYKSVSCGFRREHRTIGGRMGRSAPRGVAD